jgi:hypothetical protein
MPATLTRNAETRWQNAEPCGIDDVREKTWDEMSDTQKDLYCEMLLRNPETLAALREAEAISRNPSAYKTYTVEEMFAEVEAEYQAELASGCLN